jgi:O-antigen ligase
VLAFGLCALAALLDRPAGEAVRSPGAAPRGLAVMGIATAGLALVATGLAFSRGAWLAVAIGGAAGVGIAVAARRPQLARRWLVALGASGVVALALLIPYGSAFAARVDPSPDRPASEIRSIDERVVLAGAAIQVAAAHPLLGTGLGTLPQAMASEVPDLDYLPQPAHVVLLTALAETGVPGALGMAGLLCGPWLALRRRRSAAAVSGANASGTVTADLAPAAALLAAIVVVGLVDYYPWTFAAGRTWTAIGVGLWAAVAAPPRSAA